MGRVNPGAINRFGEGVTRVYLSATALLSGRPSPSGRGELSPQLASSPVRRRQQGCALARSQAPCRARRAASEAPRPTVLSHGGHSKPFLLRSELVWTREGKLLLSRNNPWVVWTQRFLARSQPPHQVCDKREPCCGSMQLVETNNRWVMPAHTAPATRKRARAFETCCTRRAINAHNLICKPWMEDQSSGRWKTSVLFLAVFTSPKAARERTGKQWEINDIPAAGGRAELYSKEKAGRARARSGVLR